MQPHSCEFMQVQKILPVLPIPLRWHWVDFLPLCETLEWLFLIRKWIRACVKVALSGKYVTFQIRVNYPLEEAHNVSKPEESTRRFVGRNEIIHVWRMCLCMCRLSTQGPPGERGERGEPGDEGYQVDKPIK